MEFDGKNFSIKQTAVIEYEEKKLQDIKITDVREVPGDAAFLIDTGKNAILYDSGFAFTGNAVAQKIKSLLGERNLDYIFLTHSHYDHALGSVYIKKMYPETQIVASEYAAKIFAKSTAREVMRTLDQKHATTCGITEYQDLIDNLGADITVNDGDEIQAEDIVFEIISLPGHTKCSVGFYCRSKKLLLGCETLGVFNGKDNIVPSFLVGYDMTIKSIEKVRDLEIEHILVPHFGLVSKSTAKLYLEKSYTTTKSIAKEFSTLIKEGKTNQDILCVFKEKFYHGSIVEAYPIDAMTLNVGIMTDLIRKELAQK